jgi:hypothetical protein
MYLQPIRFRAALSPAGPNLMRTNRCGGLGDGGGTCWSGGGLACGRSGEKDDDVF